MILILLRSVVMALCYLVALPVAGLDFDKEIRKQDKHVKVKYLNPPRSVASFYRLYVECQAFKGSERFHCNRTQAQAHYNDYRERWQERQRQRQGQVQTGELAVSLEPKAKEAQNSGFYH